MEQKKLAMAASLFYEMGNGLMVPNMERILNGVNSDIFISTLRC